MSKRIELKKQKFGKLMVTEFAHTNSKGVAFWKCICECGNEVTIASGHLRNGHTRSCGCLQTEMATKNSLGNIWGRKFKDAKMSSAKSVWIMSYHDGCSFETFLKLSQEDCHYCGTAPSNSFNKYLTKEGKITNEDVSAQWANEANFIYNGLDRIDSSIGHTEDNIVPCCIKCNRAKRDMSIDEFKNWLIKAYNHFIKEKSQ